MFDLSNNPAGRKTYRVYFTAKRVLTNTHFENETYDPPFTSTQISSYKGVASPTSPMR